MNPTGVSHHCRDPLECGWRHCVVCAGHLEPDEPQTCVACLGRVRRDLADIVELFALLPDQLGHRSGPTALALMAPGSVGAFWRDSDEESRLGSTPWRPPARLRHEKVVWSKDPAEQVDQAAAVSWVAGSENPHRLSDPPSVAFELGQWEDDWRSVRGEPAATEVGTVSGAVGYLSPRAGWAAQHHPAFDDFASEVARLRSRLEVVTAMDSRPLVSGDVKCFQCGVHLRRGWADPSRCRHEQPTQQLLPVPMPMGHYGPERLESPTLRDERLARWEAQHATCDSGGLADEWHCPRCRARYDQPSFWLAMKSALQEEHDEEADGA